MKLTQLSVLIVGLILLFGSTLGGVNQAFAQQQFIRGDVNGDGLVSYPDLCFLVSYLYIGGSIPCQDASDADDNGAVDVGDILYLHNYLFREGPPPPPPFPDPGFDPTPDDLNCAGIGPFICGDATNDGMIDVGDIVFLLNYLIRGGPPPDPMGTGNPNCDEGINSADVVYLINYVFINGPPPCSPP